MIDFVKSQLPEEETTLTLASGYGGHVSARVRVCGDELEVDSNVPGWVSVREIYDHLRWKVMPGWEQVAWLGTYRHAVLKSQSDSLPGLIERLAGVVSRIEGTAVEGQAFGGTGCERGNPDQYLTIQEVASLLSCSYSEARDRMLDGRIRAIRDGRWLRARRAWIDEYVANKVVAPRRADSAVRVIGSRSSRKKPVIFKKGGLGYQFLKERQENQEK
jgi:excisionase family DNA binding protein